MPQPQKITLHGVEIVFDRYDHGTPYALLTAAETRYLDRYRLVLINNLRDNNPGELPRWYDDGGR